MNIMHTLGRPQTIPNCLYLTTEARRRCARGKMGRRSKRERPLSLLSSHSRRSPSYNNNNYGIYIAHFHMLNALYNE